MSGSKLKLHLKPSLFGQVVHAAGPHCCKLSTLAPIEYLSSDHITIWYICKRCSFAHYLASVSPISDLINIGWVTTNNAQLSALFDRNSTNIERIANWRHAAKRAYKIASFTYISYCDRIRTPILNWNQSAEIGKLWNRPKNHGVSAVRFFAGLKPIAMVSVWFQPRPGTELRMWNRCWHYWWIFRKHVGEPAMTRGVPGSTGDKLRSMGIMVGSADHKPRSTSHHAQIIHDQPGSAGAKFKSTCAKPGSASDNPESTCNCFRLV